MKTKTVIRENLTLTDEKIKSMCRLNFEDNDFLFTMENGYPFSFIINHMLFSAITLFLNDGQCFYIHHA